MPSFRPACEADAERLLRWANDPAARAASLSTAPIAWDAHVTWLRGRLRDPNCDLLVVCDTDGEPFGMVRFDLRGDEAVVSVNLDPAARGRGLGARALAAACRGLFARRRVGRVRAIIRVENRASRRAFEKAGFRRAQAAGDAVGPDVLHYTLERSVLECAPSR